MTADEEVIRCELCQVPHRRETVVCDHCGHHLGEPLDLGMLEGELGGLRRSIGWAVLACVGLVAINLFLIQGGGLFVVAAPIGWLAWRVHRYRIVRRLIAQGKGPNWGVYRTKG